ncbi:MAG: pilus assembly protein PapD [Nevskia sp.]|nr:pilus assembly protein PapD [Nevskia sp.]
MNRTIELLSPIARAAATLRVMARGFAVLALAICLPVAAASLQVSPVTLSFDTGQPALGLTLRNTGDSALTGQVRIFAWSQDGKDDVLKAVTEGLVASPPMATIAPAGEQVVRVVRTNRQPQAREQTFRLLIDELPPAQGTATPGSAEAGISFRLRYSIPVFIPAPGMASEPKLSWTLKHHDDAWFLGVSNQGASHAQLSAVTLRASDGTRFEVSAGLLGYALAGSGREWRLPESFRAALASNGLQVESTINTHSAPAAAVAVSGN